MRTIDPDSVRQGSGERLAPVAPAKRLTGLVGPDFLTAAFLTVGELREILRIGRNQAYALVNSGEVPSCRVGGSIRVPRSAVDRLLKGMPARSEEIASA